MACVWLPSAAGRDKVGVGEVYWWTWISRSIWAMRRSVECGLDKVDVPGAAGNCFERLDTRIELIDAGANQLAEEHVRGPEKTDVNRLQASRGIWTL